MLENMLVSIVVNILIDVVRFVSRYGARRTIHIDCLTQYGEVNEKTSIESFLLLLKSMSLQMMITRLSNILFR